MIVKQFSSKKQIEFNSRNIGELNFIVIRTELLIFNVSTSKFQNRIRQDFVCCRQPTMLQ